MSNQSDSSWAEAIASTSQSAAMIFSAPLNPASVSSKKIAVLESFSLFRKLPEELRRKIWRCAAKNEKPRMVELRWNTHKTQYTSQALSPPILHATLESRHEACRLYRPLNFGDDETGTFVCWEKDIILMGRCNTGTYDLSDPNYDNLHANCRYLAVRQEAYGGLLGLHFDRTVSRFSTFKKLKELLVIFEMQPTSRGDKKPRLAINQDFMDFLGTARIQTPAPHSLEYTTILDSLLAVANGHPNDLKIGGLDFVRGSEKKLTGDAKKLKWANKDKEVLQKKVHELDKAKDLLEARTTILLGSKDREIETLKASIAALQAAAAKDQAQA